MTQHNERDLAYLAGFLDGEGCINILRGVGTGKTPQYGMQVVLTNTNQQIIESLGEQFGGKFYRQKRKRTNATDHPRECFMVWWNGRGAVDLLNQLEPYVRVKHAQLLNALEFQKVKAQRVGRAMPEHLLVELARLHGVGKHLNSHEVPLEVIPAFIEADALQLEMDVA